MQTMHVACHGVCPLRYKVAATRQSPWLTDVNKRLSSAIYQAFCDLDYDRWSQTTYARQRLGTLRQPGRGKGGDPGN